MTAATLAGVAAADRQPPRRTRRRGAGMAAPVPAWPLPPGTGVVADGSTHTPSTAAARISAYKAAIRRLVAEHARGRP